MPVLNVVLQIPMRVVCGQCGVEMQQKGVQQPNPTPVLECPQCGYKIRLESGPAMKIPTSMKSRYPPLKPKRF